MSHSRRHAKRSALHGQHEAGQPIVVPAIDIELGVIKKGANLFFLFY
jgi:hypothetical protein